MIYKTIGHTEFLIKITNDIELCIDLYDDGDAIYSVYYQEPNNRYKIIKLDIELDYTFQSITKINYFI